MEAESCVPPGFRFYPTEEELVGYYLQRKIDSKQVDFDVITDIDLYRIEPWDIQGRCKLGCEEKNEWYFFSHKDKKYPTGTRTNRATAAGFWKATGRDKSVISKHKVIGMRKTLVFYKGRAPNGKKTDWIMHEYRLQTSEEAPPQDEGWVVCRAFKKPSPSHKQRADAWNHAYYVMDQQHFGINSVQQPSSDPYHVNFHPQSFDYDQDFGSSMVHYMGHNQLTQVLPQLESPSISPHSNQELIVEHCTSRHSHYAEIDDGSNGGFIDWESVDKLLASQLTEMASPSQSDHPPNHNQNYYIDDNTNEERNLPEYFPNL